MNTKHTPGPWTLHPCNDGRPQAVDMGHEGESFVAWTFTVGKGETIVADCSAYSNGNRGRGYRRASTRGEVEANARLIAAAPDLLEALQKVLAFAETPVSMSADHDGILAEVRAAIAKATGETI